MFQVKICGITTIDDSLRAAEAGADAIGLNFYAPSPRFVKAPLAHRIVEALPPGVVKVGLFVNALSEHIRTMVDHLGLDLVQLHGDEPPEALIPLAGLAVMKAFRVGPAGLTPLDEYIGRCRVLGHVPKLVLLDAQVAGQYGGTGVKLDWQLAAAYADDASRPPMVLAGGLNAGNVAEAIAQTRPAAVDTASGVESSPGRKDPEAMRQFVAAARGAFGRVPLSRLRERG